MPVEILLLFFLISFLVYTMPDVLVAFSRTSKGKLMLLLLTIMVTLYNRTGGILMVMFIIFLAEYNYEVISEGFTSNTLEESSISNPLHTLDIVSGEEKLRPRDSAQAKQPQGQAKQPQGQAKQQGQAQSAATQKKK